MSESCEESKLLIKEEISDSYIVFDASERDGYESDVEDEDPLDKRLVRRLWKDHYLSMMILWLEEMINLLLFVYFQER